MRSYPTAFGQMPLQKEDERQINADALEQVPYTPAPSNANAAGLDPVTADRIDRIENVLSVVVRHNPGIGGYDAVREWLACEWRFLPEWKVKMEYITSICRPVHGLCVDMWRCP